jgi:hypothetical protein
MLSVIRMKMVPVLPIVPAKILPAVNNQVNEFTI